MKTSKELILAGSSLLSATDVCTLLSKQIEEAGSQANWCRDNKISTAYLSDVLNSRRQPGQKILDVLGLEVVTFYRPK